MKRSHKHYKSAYNPQVKSSDKIPKNRVLTTEDPLKRDFSEISNKEKLVEYFKIPKKPKIAPPKNLIDYIQNTSPKFDESPQKCMEHPHKVHTHISPIIPPKWAFKPVLADEFCLYFENNDVHIKHVTIYDPGMHCIFNLTMDQAIDLYPETMEENPTFSEKIKKICKKSKDLSATNDHDNILIIDSGADTSGISGN